MYSREDVVRAIKLACDWDFYENNLTYDQAVEAVVATLTPLTGDELRAALAAFPEVQK